LFKILCERRNRKRRTGKGELAKRKAGKENLKGKGERK